MFPVELLITAVCGWLHREQADLIAFLREENRVLKARLRGRRLRLSDEERRRPGELGHRLGRRLLAQVATALVHESCGLGVERPDSFNPVGGVSPTSRLRG